METKISRRSFLKGLGVAAVGSATVGVTAELAGCATPATNAPTAETPESSRESSIYQVIGEKLNPQDYDYRGNSGDLSHVLSPWKLSNMEFSNRIVKPAAGSNYERASWDTFIEYHERMAKGGIELIWVKNFTHIFLGYTHIATPNIDTFVDEDVIRLTDAIHAAGAKCGTQTDLMGSAFQSGIASRGPSFDCNLLTVEEIDYIVDCYRNAARKIKEWGFDAYELNCAGDNMPQWFFSKARNHREDEYGPQSFENRVRFIGRVISAVHEECGDDFPVQILMDGIEESDQNLGQNAECNTIEDCIEIAKLLEKAGVDSLHVRLGPIGQHAGQFLSDLFFDTRGCAGTTSFGTQYDFSRHFQGSLIANHDGCGLMLDVAKRFKDVLSIPVGTVTYIDPAHAPDFIDQAVADGKVDFLMVNRPLTVDGEYIIKLTEGRFDEIRPCTRCCHCWNDTSKETPIPISAARGGRSYACRLDPVRDFVGMADKGLVGSFDPPPGDGEKKVMVVGAGPAGMEAARIAAERGYIVSLYEKSSAIGGLLNFAAVIKGPHQNLEDYRAWSQHDLELKGVTVVTGQEVDAAFIKEQAPDVVILALGGKRDAIKLSGDDATQVVSIDDVASAPIGQNVTIIGSNCQATDVAVYLLEQGKQVTIITPDEINMVAKGQSHWCKIYTLPMIYARGTRVWSQAEPQSIGGGSVTVKTNTGTEVTYPCDTVIEAMDMLPNKDMLDGLSGIEAYAVGDCDDPYNIQYAIRAGHFKAREI
jgi:2,4-dienoyl-CoA reductase-like NADH-dependent reductase (Old Yellow Enzyme family)/thioredoxin reductase